MKTLPFMIALFAIAPAHAEEHNHDAAPGVLEISVADVIGFEALRPTDVSWRECEGDVTGNYSGAGCTTRKIHDDFLPFLKQNAIRCTNAGLAAVGAASVAKVHIVHDGVVADSRHSRRSLHAIGRAIDIQQIKAGGRSFDFRVTSNKPDSADRKFYEGFRQCWHSIHVQRGCPRRDSGYPVGTIGWEDRNHRSHHLHASMPYCPSSRGFFTTSFGYDPTNDVEEDAEIDVPFVETLDI